MAFPAGPASSVAPLGALGADHRQCLRKRSAGLEKPWGKPTANDVRLQQGNEQEYMNN